MRYSYCKNLLTASGGVIALSLIPAPLLHAEPTSGLEISFDRLRDSKGQVCLSLFAGARKFPEGGADSDFLEKRCAPVENGSAAILFKDLKAGSYAATAFHDANGDGTLNKGDFGIPMEGFGFSNNPPIGFSAPSFEETKFQVTPTPTVVKIQMNYMN